MQQSTKLVNQKNFGSRKTKMHTLDEDIIESEVEFETDVVEPDYDAPQEMGDPSAEPTEEEEEASQESKSKAMEAIFEGKLNEALHHLTEAIILNPRSPILYASRAIILVKLKKPNAAVRDADVSLMMRPDLAKGYKARGMAKATLGLWEHAARDLRVASKLDFDEETSMMLKRVVSDAKKIEEHRLKYERLRKERELEKLRLFKEAKYASVLRDGLVIEIESASDLEAKLDAAAELSRLAIVYFTAKWCGPCRFVGPIYASLAAKYPKIMFLKVDIDVARDAAFQWTISSIPSFYLSKERHVVDNVLDIDMNSLERKICQHSG